MAVQFSSGALEEYQRIVRSYPAKRAAIMPVLWLAQKEFGHLSAEVQQYVADLMGFPIAWVSGLASFYTMYYKKPIGRYHLQICTNVSCMLRGSDDILRVIEERVDCIFATVHEVDHARWEAGLLDQLQHARHCQRGLL